MDLGTWKIEKKGYQKLTLRNMKPTAKEDWNSKNNALETVKVTGVGEINYCPVGNAPKHYYWCRRGPSGILWHKYPKNIDVKYWYSELKVPSGQDTPGAYFMASGFNVGYLGMQVNSATERRVLFSVWSPFVTDDPKEIPVD